MDMVFVQFKSVDGTVNEGRGSKYHNNERLSEGLWSVRGLGDDTTIIMAVDDLSPHWQEQLQKWHKFGRKLG